MSAPRRAEVVWVELDGETVVCTADGAALHHLDEFATAVWRGLDGRTPLAQHIDVLRAAYSVTAVATRDQVRRDVEAFVGQMVALGLVLVDTDGPDQRIVHASSANIRG